MNVFVANPDWGKWIILYFFLGGIAAGAYFVSALIDLTARSEYRDLARVGYWIAFPLIVVCGLFLTIDLERPERFWHMLFRSEIVHEAVREGWPGSSQSWKTMSGAFLLKPWSPMSVGSWALTSFGLCSFLSLLGSLWPNGRLERWFRESILARVIQVVGTLVGFFVAAYTGTLLSATNQPLWSDSTWVSPLFLTSAASTGISAMILLVQVRHGFSNASVLRLERADLYALILESIVFCLFLLSVGTLLAPALATGSGKLLVVGTLVIGLAIPIALHFHSQGHHQGSALAAAVFSLVGGFMLRYAIVTTPSELLARAQPQEQPAMSQDAKHAMGDPRQRLIAGFSPEDGRKPGEGPGADPGNKTALTQPHSKVFHESR